MYNALDIALPEMFAILIVWLHELFAALISSCTNCFTISKIRELLVPRRFDVLQYYVFFLPSDFSLPLPRLLDTPAIEYNYSTFIY